LDKRGETTGGNSIIKREVSMTFLDAIKKFMPYLIVAAAILFNVGSVATWWTPDNTTWISIDGLLGTLFGASVRVTIADAMSKIDLTPVITYLAQSKTIITFVITTVVNGGVLLHFWTLTNPWLIILNAVLVPLGFGFLQAGQVKLHRLSLKYAGAFRARAGATAKAA
jgi:uncharacterized membrane protein